MALHKLTITVVDGGTSGKQWGSSSLKQNEKLPNPKDNKLYKLLNYNETLKNKVKQSVSPTTFFAVQTGVNLASQTAKQFINYYVSDIGRKSGDSNYQSIINRRIEEFTDVASVAGGAIAGATAGSIIPGVGTAIGAIIGATVGAASAGINLGFKYAERQRAYAYEIFKESNNQAYNLSRANFSAMTGRVR